MALNSFKRMFDIGFGLQMVLEEVELKQSKTGERAPMSEADVEAAPAAEIQRQPLRNKFNSTDTPHA